MRLMCTSLFILVLSACGTADEPSFDSGEIQTALLPAGADISQCVPTPIAPDFCEWVGALDGFYFGDITKIQMEGLPMVLGSGTEPEVDSCPSGIVNEALAITIDVAETLVGATSPSSITFVLGIHQLDEMNPRPALHRTEGIIWGAKDKGLQVGDRIGVPVHKSSDGKLGLLGEPFFTQSADGSIVIQERARCQEPVVAGVANKGVLDVKMDISACVSGPEAQDRRVGFDLAWTTRKSWAYAGYCFGEDTPSDCGTHADCPFEKPVCNASGTCEAP